MAYGTPTGTFFLPTSAQRYEQHTTAVRCVMKVPLRILHVDDNPIDVRLTQAFLAVSGIECDVVRVDTAPALEDALQQGGFDLVLSDLVLPALDGLQALALVQRVCPGVPFIVLSGMISDKAAGRILSCGAMAYVPKHRLSDLPHSIRRVLSDGRLHAQQWA
jgi:CheY-like chemotaxis protein